MLPEELHLVATAHELTTDLARKLPLLAVGIILTAKRFQLAIEQLFKRIDEPSLPPQQTLLDLPLQAVES